MNPEFDEFEKSVIAKLHGQPIPDLGQWRQAGQMAAPDLQAQNWFTRLSKRLAVGRALAGAGSVAVILVAAVAIASTHVPSGPSHSSPVPGSTRISGNQASSVPSASTPSTAI